MTIRVALHHATTYRFDHPVRIFPHEVRLRPAPHSRTPVSAYTLTVSPADHFINWQQDPFGNHVARLVFPEPAEELSIVVDLIADMTVINPFDFFLEEYAEHYPFSYPALLRDDLAPYLRFVPAHGQDAEPPADPADDQVQAWIEQRLRPLGVLEAGCRTVDLLVAVNRAVQQEIAYTVRLETGVQDPGETLDLAIGSCRDSAWLLVAALRRLGLAARFVSGYLVQLRADIAPLEGPAGPSEDFTDLHAWAEVYLPGAGWVGMDATSGLFAGEGHIPLSATPHPASSAPISGSIEPTGVHFEFSNTVTRIHEDVRVTKPYSESQWAAIDALGEHIDAGLAEQDVRLTMGGEPTFVSAAGTASPQWESAADGEEKRRLAHRLADLLRDRWAPQGVTHHGQGKWYPGEPLPRWAIEIAWRLDGAPLWHDRALLADPWSPASLPGEPVARATLLADFAADLAARLGVADDCLLAAHEDPVELLAAELRRPLGDPPEFGSDPVDPLRTGPRDRARMAEELDRSAAGAHPGTATPAGWVIPLFIDPESDPAPASATVWATTRWRTRRGALFLTPGSSPLGLRLPLDAIAWQEGPDIVRNADGDPRRPLPDPAAATPAPPARVLPIEQAPRTALAVQEREGHLFVFLPPLDRLDDAVSLLAAVERSAAALGVPVVLEGYPLPRDDRLRSISVTPDPGVIEVNVYPTRNWAELRELTRTLYQDARQAGLSTEKFDLDGTHTGTGGGNHITLGGPGAADSPLLRRPDLLVSLITYWQHHPSLSYVFTGRFIGPTSQAPRIDEGLPGTLHDLQIAFDEMAAMIADPTIDHDLAAVIAADHRWQEEPAERIARQRRTQPWLVDKLLRNLLTDLTGNTHRAEFCIDKLYNPQRGGGQAGLLELRGFEMPPHPEMSLVQALLVRALVLRFWEQPYREPLIDWGTRLHDRFLLPAFVAGDLRRVITELNEQLGPQAPHFEEAWLEAFLEFRFPRLGEVDLDGVHLELRQAIEPWQVLGEEIALGGTARYVDSSLERVQVAVTGLDESRHVLTCNGVPMPLVSPTTTGWGVGGDATAGARVSGVRFRAWAPPSALHPTIGIHAPLHIDLVDRLQGRSLGGFTYHVVHPGGRNYDSYPVNAASAEARRASRFEVNQTSGAVDLSGWPASGALLGPGPTLFPATLDLRRFDRGRLPSATEEPDA